MGWPPHLEGTVQPCGYIPEHPCPPIRPHLDSTWDPLLALPLPSPASLPPSLPPICISPGRPPFINLMFLNPYFQLCFWETQPKTGRQPCNQRGIMNVILIMSSTTGRYGIAEEEVTRVGRKDQRHLHRQPPPELNCGERVSRWRAQHVQGLGAGDGLWVCGAQQSSSGGPGPKRDWQAPEKRGLESPPKSLDFTAGERHIQNCLQKCPLATTALSRQGAREAAPATFNHQADRDGEGDWVGGAGGTG